jgi:nitrous oxidase accessory protein
MRYCLIILTLLLLQCAHARTYIVRNGSIQQTITAAASGDTVMVFPGIYRDKGIVITRPVYLKGIGYPVLDGEKKFEVIAIKADHVTIEGFKVIHSGNSAIEDIAGIKIYNSRNAVIRNNILDDNFFGIYSQYGRECIIQHNTITAYGKAELQSGNGIHCWKSDNMQITDNRITGHRDGIYFEFVTRSVISGNISRTNIRYGLHFMFSHTNVYTGNTFEKNGAGVAVMYSHGVKMFRNTFRENWGDAAYGLLLKEISDSFIEGNIFVKNTIGIFMDGTSKMELGKNAFSNNGWGMKIQANCMDITVSQNNFLGNTFDVGTNGELVLNKFSHNYWDKYEGYDLNRDRVGDIPFRPVSMYSMIVEKNPPAMILFRSFIAGLLDKTEKVFPSLIPENLKDDYPLMKPLPL